jgi:hypothetical protein
LYVNVISYIISNTGIPDFSKHCILRGLLAVVPLDVLTATSPCSSLFFSSIFTELLEIAGKYVPG